MRRVALIACLFVPFASGCPLLNEILGGCDFETDPNCEDPTRGQITGTVSVPGAGGAATDFVRIEGALARHIKDVMSAERARTRPADTAVPTKGRMPRASRNNLLPGALRSERFRAGEVLLKTHEPMRERKPELEVMVADWLAQKMPGVGRVEVGLCGRPDRCLIKLFVEDKIPLSLSDTQEAALALAEAPFAVWAEKNLILQRLTAPNDEFYSLMWHYQAIDAQAAWDITTGDPSRVCAVIDTGILMNHPDLEDRVVPGADLIDDEGIANDGDGRDMDGDDAGDQACGGTCHSHHGSHVAGTIGASTDNGVMIAGLTWDGALQPVRVLGVGGGTLADIADGIFWAAGFTDIEGVSDNPTPADVINMSLGGYGESQAMNEAVAEAASVGVIVLAAAGNDNTDASEFTPANAPEAITVASVGNTGGGRDTPRRASYSNYGSRDEGGVVDVAAPGGEQAEDIDDDGQPDGVLSTVDDYVTFYQGTSMATPHVAGVAMLLKSVNPALTQEDVRAALVSSATNVDCPEGCGAGRISAAAALLAVQGNLDGPYVVANPTVIRVGKDTLSTPVVFKNLGTDAADVTLEAPGGANRDQCELNSDGGTIAANGGLLSATLSIARTGDDRGECTITATWTGGAAEARVVWTPDVIAALQTVDVGALKIEDNGELSVERTVATTELEQFQYKLFNLTPGTYLVIGLTDTNADGDYDDDEDGVGIYFPPREDSETACTQASCGRVSVEADKTLKGADFVVAPGFNGDDGTGGTGDGGLGAPCGASEDCGGGLYCDLDLPGGYCTTDCFSDADCAGGLCFPLISGELEYQVCLKSCEQDADCDRDDGYVCDADATCYPG